MTYKLSSLVLQPEARGEYSTNNAVSRQPASSLDTLQQNMYHDLGTCIAVSGGLAQMALSLHSLLLETLFF